MADEVDTRERSGAGDGIDRRGFLTCMAWAGTGVLWTMAGGVPRASALGPGEGNDSDGADAGELTFAQISDSHIGFSKAANPDVTGTLRAAVDRINAAPTRPQFLIHTGDISHLSKPEEFDTASQIIGRVRTERAFYVPGEHDVLGDDGKLYRERYGKASRGGGWHSFDVKGVHFIGLVNVMDLKAGGLGRLGDGQLAWLRRDLEGLSSSTPIVVFAHIPLWSVYPPWGWGTDDGAQALSYLRRFGSVTVLNGHIHQTLQKVEGNVTFHTAMSTAFPQPAPGAAPSPGPMTVDAGALRGLLGVTTVRYAPGRHSLAIVDSPLQAAPTATGASVPDAVTVRIAHFSFSPDPVDVAAGAEVTWVNEDDVPHTVVSVEKGFRSPVMDTGGKFTHRFAAAGRYHYYCSLHPRMTGAVTVSAG